MLESQGLRAAYTRGGGNAASVSYRAIYSSTTDATSYSFASSDIGTESGRSLIVVAVHTAANPPSSVTVAGNNATQINTVGATLTTSSIYAISGITGNTATIVVNTSANATRCLIGVYALYNLRSTTPVDNSTSTVASGSSRTLTINSIVNGVIIGVGSAGASPRSFNWTGATENYDTAVESLSTFSGASNVTISNTTTTVSFTTLSTSLTYALASWR